jgi:hypothetical protein
MKIYSVDHPDLSPFQMPDSFRTQIVYFITPSGTHGVPELSASEYWIRLEDARQWLDTLVVLVISPLDAAAKAEIELTDEQEAWLQWMVDNQVQHVRVA